jgi:hypothetical protein
VGVKVNSITAHRVCAASLLLPIYFKPYNSPVFPSHSQFLAAGDIIAQFTLRILLNSKYILVASSYPTWEFKKLPHNLLLSLYLHSTC